MKTRIRILAMLLSVLLLALSIAGCAGNQGGNTSAPAGDAAASNAAAAPAAPAPAAEVKKLRYVAPGNDWADQDAVLAAVNEKLIADGLNIEVDLVRIPWDAWDQKTNLMLTTGEEFEMIHVMQDVKSATILRGMNAIQPLNNYIDSYPALKETLSERWAEFTVDGEILAVPVKPNQYISRDYGKIFYRKSIFEKAGAQAPTDVDGVINLALDMQELLLEETGTKCYTWTHSLSRPMTWLHRTYVDKEPFIVDNTMGIAQCFMDGTLKSFYESEEFKRDCETYRRMYELGLVHPDILTTGNENRSNAADFGQFIFGFETNDYQSEPVMNLNTGDFRGDFWLNPSLGNVEYFGIYNGNAVPTACADPNVPLSFMDWLYKDGDNYRLFMYGVEGTHYTRVGDYLMDTVNGPDDQPLYKYDDWQIGNADFQLYSSTATQKMLDEYLTPVTGTNVRTPLVGFNFDSTGVANEMANLSNEIITSIYPIKFGLVDYASNIEQAIQRLKAAGLDKVLAEYAQQYKEHYEQNKDLVGIFQK